MTPCLHLPPGAGLGATAAAAGGAAGACIDRATLHQSCLDPATVSHPGLHHTSRHIIFLPKMGTTDDRVFFMTNARIKSPK